REREQRLEQAKTFSTVMTNRMSLDGRWLRVAPQFCDLMGMSEKELLGRSFEWLAAPDELPRLRSTLRQLANGRLQQAELQRKYVLPGGRVVHAELSVSVVHEADGSPSYLFCYVLDVTETRRIQQELGQRNRFLALIADLSSRFISADLDSMDTEIERSLALIGSEAGVDRAYLLEFTPDGDELFCSHEWCGSGVRPAIQELQPIPGDIFPWLLSRHRKGEIIRLEDVSRLPPEAASDRAGLEAQDVKSLYLCPLLIGSRLIGYLGFDAIHQTRHWDSDVELMVTLSGQMLLSVLSRRRTDQALADSERRYRVLVENAADAILVFDVDQDRFLDANRQALQLLETDLETLRQSPPSRFFPERQPDGELSREQAFRMVERSLEGSQQLLEWVFLTAHGHPLPVELRLVRLPAAGQRLVRLSVLDATERKRTEAERLAYLRRTRQQHQILGRVATGDALVEGRLADVFGEITEAVGHVMELDRAGVWMFSDEMTVLQSVDLFFPAAGIHGAEETIRVEHFPAYFQAITEGVAMEVVDAWEDARTRGLAEHYLRPTGVRALIEAPIRVSGRVVGTLACEQTSGPREWSADEVGFVAAMAEQLAQAIINKERREAAAALTESERRYRILYDDSPSMFFTVDAEGFVRYANRFASEMLVTPVEELVGRPFDTLHAEREARSVDEHIHACIERAGEIRRWDSRLRTGDGQGIWIRVTARAVTESDGAPVVLAVCEDITEARKLSEELSYQAAHDALTGLYNRREFEKRLDQAIREVRDHRREHALMYMDLDQFKVINDTCGHVAGDELLRQLCAVLQQRISRRDVLARLGGDEFGVLLERCSAANAARVAESVRHAIADFQFVWGDRTFGLGVSIGVVPITAASADINDVLSMADTACYAAKDQGRNRVHIYREDDVELARRQGEMQWVSRIRHALVEERMRLWCQAIQPLHSVSGDQAGKLHYEILLRMIDERGEVVAPGAFLPAAERYTLASRLDRWVVLSTLRWLTENPETLAGMALCAINLSGRSLGDEEFLEFLLGELEHCAVPASKLCFEITETAAISNLSAATRFIRRLKSLGVSFALDDFGSGLSSFAYLKNLPVDYLKIDGMFVRDVVEDPIDFALVKSINDIGHVMGKRTIAEFVESDAVVEKLRTIGVDFVQGYWIGKPQPIDTIRDSGAVVRDTPLS
ncbi:MAG: EAL domain-containing protein, partial [Ectothiorhodospiraceae bacterium]|nr:EAL domain-containing protein [Ectothiorhodospiraceae bacterium]